MSYKAYSLGFDLYNGSIGLCLPIIQNVHVLFCKLGETGLDCSISNQLRTTALNMDVQAALELPDETDAFLQISDIIFDKESSSGYETFTDAERNFYCIDGFIRGMGNGGVAQFFYDHGHHTKDTAKALEEIKASNAIKLLKDAVSCFPDEQVPQNNDDREILVSNLEEQHGDLWARISDRFYDAETELIKLTLKYVNKHLRSFN